MTSTIIDLSVHVCNFVVNVILDLESVGTEPHSHPIPLPFCWNFLYFLSGVFEILDSELFQDNFMMALHTFEEVSDQCHATSWAVQETGCFLCCLAIVTRLHGKRASRGVQVCPGRRGRPGDTKATGDSKDQVGIIHEHKGLLLQSKGLFLSKRDNDI